MDVKPDNAYRAYDGRFATQHDHDLALFMPPPSRPRLPPPLSIKLGDLGGAGMPNMPPVSATCGDRRYLAREGVSGLGGRTCSQGMTMDDMTKLDVFALGMSV